MSRRDLIDILKARPFSLHELALLLDERPRDLEDLSFVIIRPSAESDA